MAYEVAIGQRVERARFFKVHGSAPEPARVPDETEESA